MKLKWLVVVAILTVSVGVTATPAGADEGGAKAELHNAAGNPVGVVKLTQEEDGTVMVRVNVHDLPPGFHGFHVHTVGKCEAPGFTSAGGHFNPLGRSHPGHAGDMPVLLVNDDGTGEARFKTDRLTIDKLLDADGSAIIVHLNPDNYANIPDRYAPTGPDAATLNTGDAGGRIACGVITGG